MKRRRQLLQVSTFPFLAVLLCALGALILVLLSMDRKAKLAALQKGQQQQRDEAAAATKAAAERAAVNEGRTKAAKASWERKRAALRKKLDDEEKAVAAELAAVRARLDEAATKLSGEQAKARELRERLKSEKGAVAQQEQELIAARQRAETMARRVGEADRERARLTADLARLEQQLKDVREAREKEPARYSVVPYFGRQGEDRKPLYVECAAEGVIFHPDKKRLDTGGSRGELRAELERRLAGPKGEKPYVLMLVRPDGIRRYYEVQAVVQGLGVDSGYELVNGGWELDYPAEARAREGEARAREGEARAREGEAPAEPRAITPPKTAMPHAGAPPAARQEPRPPELAPRPAGESATAAIGPPQGPPDKPGRVLGLVGLSRPQPFGGAAPANEQAPRVAPQGGGASATSGEPGASATGAARSELKRPAPVADAPGSPPVADAPGSPQPSAGGTTTGPKMAPTQRETRLRPATITGDAETVVHVECRRDTAVVHPGGRRVAIDALNHSPAHNPLLRAIKEQVGRRQAMASAGAPPRVAIRFLVHRDGVETYHLAYPALAPLDADKKAHWLRPEDDVRQVIDGR